MNRLILALIICCGLTACDNNGTKKSASTDVEQAQQLEQKDHVEVLYFHGKQRCATCMAIELKNGTLVFRTIDISDPKNETIAEKYEVTWSSLFVSKWKDGKETYENLTEYAFANARTAPDTFKNGITEKVRTLLK
ncbi:nitrophenyl compound nitroreductase subunit ArsF family protein [Alistipes putredinis]|uniref:nitrophenyl compound nitroreductase subunit ArsF family protein n=1 Tax=Alistipes putredinis TaxID=28117 RepID=UPI003966AFB5